MGSMDIRIRLHAVGNLQDFQYQTANQFSGTYTPHTIVYSYNYYQYIHTKFEYYVINILVIILYSYLIRLKIKIKSLTKRCLN